MKYRVVLKNMTKQLATHYTGWQRTKWRYSTEMNYLVIYQDVHFFTNHIKLKYVQSLPWITWTHIIYLGNKFYGDTKKRTSDNIILKSLGGKEGSFLTNEHSAFNEAWRWLYAIFELLKHKWNRGNNFNKKEDETCCLHQNSEWQAKFLGGESRAL